MGRTPYHSARLGIPVAMPFPLAIRMVPCVSTVLYQQSRNDAMTAKMYTQLMHTAKVVWVSAVQGLS
eukprot:gene2418-biopygen3152